MFSKCQLFCVVFVIYIMDTNISCFRSAGNKILVKGACEYPNLEHGFVRIRSNIATAHFRCRNGYQLIGNTNLVCRGGNWNSAPPVCIRKGCPVLKALDHGFQIKRNNGAWVIFFCHPGFNLVGSSEIYCDGKQWNDTAPICVGSNLVKEASCDFEQDTCGWLDDPRDDFDWTRNALRTPSAFSNTGPKHDHTLGQNASGHYLFIESTGKLENESARLISPVFGAEWSTGCLSFFYHMLGRGMGSLKVIQKPVETDGSFEMTEDIVLFERSGSQGDFWLQNISRFHESNGEFQIVIEGVRGVNYMSDLAIDDIKLLDAEQCKTALENFKAVELPELKTDSCLNRCFNETLLHTNDGEDFQCHCTLSCLETGLCCTDFPDYCGDSTDIYLSDRTTEEITPSASKSTWIEADPKPKTTTMIVSTTTQAVKATSLTTSTIKPITKPSTVTSVITSRSTVASSTTKILKTTPINKIITTPKIITLVFKTSTKPPFNATGILSRDNMVVTNYTNQSISNVGSKPSTTITTTLKPIPTIPDIKFEHEMNKANIPNRNTSSPKNNIREKIMPRNNSYLVVPYIVVFLGIVLIVAGAALFLKSSYAPVVLTRLRLCKETHNSDVHYLIRDQEVDIE